VPDRERRGGARTALTFKVEYADADDLFVDFSENISRGGMFVLTDRELHIGDPVRLILSFPGLLRPMPLAGEVKWVRREPPDQRGVGIEFDPSSEALGRLGQVVERLSAGDATLLTRVVEVLVVDDNPLVSTLIRDGLTAGANRELKDRVSFRFHEAKDGRAAVELLRRHRVDLVILDVYLPVLDGVQVIREARAEGLLDGVPVIAVSGGGTEARTAMLAAGADFFIDKPMRLADIVATMRRLSGLKLS
jgi:type IV pilus assembly protein PilZ